MTIEIRAVVAHFPDFQSLRNYAAAVHYRRPMPGETEAQYREGLAAYVVTHHGDQALAFAIRGGGLA